MPSRRGKKNKRTIYREHLERVKQLNGGVDKISGNDHIGESLEVMAEAMHFFAQMARSEETLIGEVSITGRPLISRSSSRRSAIQPTHP
jgi:hypothetical protein